MAEKTGLETIIRNEGQINRLMDLFADAVVLIGEDLRIADANRSAVSLLDMPAGAFRQGTPVKEFLTRLAHRGDFAVSEVKATMQNALAALINPKKAVALGNFSVDQRDVAWWAVPGPGECVALMFRKISDPLRALLQDAPLGVAISDRKTGKFLFYNPRFSELLGAGCLPEAEFNDTLLISERFRVGMLRELQSGRVLEDSELRLKTGDRPPRWFLTTIAEMCFEGRDAILWWLRDITEQKQLAREVKASATTDPLTGLANRAKFTGRLERAARMITGTDKAGAVMLLDLDGLKRINDGFGHECGDFVLKEVAGRLKCTARGADVIARSDGDCFAVLYASNAGTAGLTGLVRAVLSAVEEPMLWENQTVKISTSIGISLFDGSVIDGHEALKQAEAAMYDAKQAGKGQFRFASPGLC